MLYSNESVAETLKAVILSKKTDLSTKCSVLVQITHMLGQRVCESVGWGRDRGRDRGSGWERGRESGEGSWWERSRECQSVD